MILVTKLTKFLMSWETYGWDTIARLSKSPISNRQANKLQIKNILTWILKSG